MNPHRFLLTVLLLSPSLATARDILDFNALPDCAYACKDLYTAQHACSAQESPVSCFCTHTATHRADKTWGCNSVCGTSAQQSKVQTWLTDVCSAPSPFPPAKPAKQKPANDDDDDDDDGVAAAQTWWSAHWPYLLLAALLTTIPILLFAFAVPVRKYVKRQIVRRRVRRGGLLHVAHWTPPPPQDRTSSLGSRGQYYENGGLHDVEPGSHYDSGGIGSHSEVGTPADAYVSSGQWRGSGVGSEDVVPKPSSVRQESWERRLRNQFSEGAGGQKIISKLAFWRRGGRDEEGGEYKTVMSNRGSMVGTAL